MVRATAGIERQAYRAGSRAVDLAGTLRFVGRLRVVVDLLARLPPLAIAVALGIAVGLTFTLDDLGRGVQVGTIAASIALSLAFSVQARRLAAQGWGDQAWRTLALILTAIGFAAANRPLHGRADVMAAGIAWLLLAYLLWELAVRNIALSVRVLRWATAVCTVGVLGFLWAVVTGGSLMVMAASVVLVALAVSPLSWAAVRKLVPARPQGPVAPGVDPLALDPVPMAAVGMVVVGAVCLATVWVLLGELPVEVGVGLRTVIVLAAVVVGLLVTNGVLVHITVVSLLVAVTVFSVVAVDGSPAEPHDGHAAGAIVAIGDSYMSGEGADRYFPGTNVDGVNECRRASTAYPWRVAEALGRGLVFAACSGAQTVHLLTVPHQPASPESLFGGRPQVLAALGDVPPWAPEQRLFQQLSAFPGTPEQAPDTAVVLVSIGGNDALFAEIGSTCAAPASCVVYQDRWLDNLHMRVGPAIEDVLRRVRATAGDGPVVAMTYPIPIAPDRPSGCWSTMEASEHRFLAHFVGELNDVITAAAGNVGVWVFDAESVFEGGRICDTDAEGRVLEAEETLVHYIAVDPVGGTLDDVLLTTDWIRSSFHPKPAGHEVLAGELGPWLAADVIDNPVPAPAADRTPYRSVVDPFEPAADDGPGQAPIIALDDVTCDVAEAFRGPESVPGEASAPVTVDFINTVSVLGGSDQVTIDDVRPSWPVCVRGEDGAWQEVRSDALGVARVEVAPGVTELMGGAEPSAADPAEGEEVLAQRGVAIYVNADDERVMVLTEECDAEREACARSLGDWVARSTVLAVREVVLQIALLFTGAGLLAIGLTVAGTVILRRQRLAPPS